MNVSDFEVNSSFWGSRKKIQDSTIINWFHVDITSEPLAVTDLGTGKLHWKHRNQKWFVATVRIPKTKLEPPLWTPGQPDGRSISLVSTPFSSLEDLLAQGIAAHDFWVHYILTQEGNGVRKFRTLVNNTLVINTKRNKQLKTPTFCNFLSMFSSHTICPFS